MSSAPSEQYADDRNLVARRSIYAYATGSIDLFTWVLAHARWRGDERVLDAGCGDGAYLERLAAFPEPPRALVGLDASRGMLDAVRSRVAAARLVAADVADVPFGDESFDVVIAAHMLYHVSDPAAGAKELGRVLRPAGALLAVTNGRGHVRELHDLYLDAVEDASGQRPADPVVASVDRFSAENGAVVLAEAFTTIRSDRLQGTLEVPAARPIVDYIASTRTTREPSLPDGVAWDDVVALAAQRAESRISADGSFPVTTDVWAFVCRRDA